MISDADFVSLERLSRSAADASLRSRHGHLADDQFDSLAVHLLAIGIRAFRSFDASLTISDRDGFSFAFRSMRGYREGRFTEGPYIDWVRSNVRDHRFEPEGSTAVTASGDLPESAVVETGSFDAAVLDLGRDLSSGALWALEHVVRPQVERGERDAEIALRHGLSKADVAGLRRGVADELAGRLGLEEPGVGEVGVDAVLAWVAA